MVLSFVSKKAHKAAKKFLTNFGSLSLNIDVKIPYGITQSLSNTVETTGAVIFEVGI